LVQSKPETAVDRNGSQSLGENRADKGAQRPSGETLDSMIFSEKRQPSRSTANRIDCFFR
jgi:hypothetical protein